MNTRVLTAHIPMPLAIKVDEMAMRLERSRGWIIKQALHSWLQQAEFQPGAAEFNSNTNQAFRRNYQIKQVERQKDEIIS